MTRPPCMTGRGPPVSPLTLSSHYTVPVLLRKFISHNMPAVMCANQITVIPEHPNLVSLPHLNQLFLTMHPNPWGTLRAVLPFFNPSSRLFERCRKFHPQYTQRVRINCSKTFHIHFLPFHRSSNLPIPSARPDSRPDYTLPYNIFAPIIFYGKFTLP